MSATKVSLSLGARKKPAATNGVKRPHAALRDHDDEAQNESRAQTVTHFDHSGAVDAKKPAPEQGPMVIAPQKNRDWKEASARNKRARYAQVADAERAVNRGDVGLEEEKEKKTVFGLNVMRKDDVDGPEDEAEDDSDDTPHNGIVATPQQPRTADEEAMAALLGEKKQSTLVLPAMSEEQAFDRDYKTAPDMSTLEDYDRVPVEEFGAAMLRGMGWKDGEGIGSERGNKAVKTSALNRRPALLGIGAKEEAAVADEMGAWGKAARNAKGGEVKIYNPVLLREKRTGEMFTEQEAEKRKAKAERERFETEFEEAERKKSKDGERDGERKSSKRESSRERNDRKERDRRKRDDSDEEYYRRKKEKERRRRERDRDGDHGGRDRERSRKHESDRDRRHGSDRDRHQDRHRERR